MKKLTTFLVILLVFSCEKKRTKSEILKENILRTLSNLSMKIKIILVFLFASYSLSFSQSISFEKEMQDALKIHDTATIVTSEVASLKAFEKLMKKYPDKWLPSYWASYLCTQIGRLDGISKDFPKDMSGLELISRAKKYLDLSKEINKNPTNDEKSNLLMLEGFIFSFYSGYNSKNEELKNKFDLLKKAKYKEAIKYNRKNPLMYVFAGIRLTNSDNYGEVMSGVGLLDYAELIYNKVENRAMAGYWNKDFIKFWRSKAEEKLKKLLEDQ